MQPRVIRHCFRKAGVYASPEAMEMELVLEEDFLELKAHPGYISVDGNISTSEVRNV